MLPSKGYFSAIPCPFYDLGSCERPHCHFRHSKKDRADTAEENAVKTDINVKGISIKQLGSEKVKQVTENSESATLNKDVTAQETVTNFQPSVQSAIETSQKDYSNSSDIPSYKPTPIAELNKKHIPVAYAPTRPFYSDRLRKRDIRESVLYTPKSICDNSLLTTTYIPSSSKVHCEAYSPEIVSSCRYLSSQISDDSSTVNNDDLSISVDNNDESSMHNYRKLTNPTLEALDKLIDDEFDENPSRIISFKSKVSGVNNVNTKSSKSALPTIINHNELNIQSKNVLNSQPCYPKLNDHSTDSVTKHSSIKDKQNNSKSVARSSENSSKSISTEKHSKGGHSSKTKQSSSHQKLSHSSKSKVQGTDNSSKHSSSHDKKHSHSKDKSKLSKDHSKDNPKVEKQNSSKGKNHSHDSYSKPNHDQDKSKLKHSKQKCIKDKDKHGHSKDKSKSASIIVNDKKNYSIDDKINKRKDRIKREHNKHTKKELSSFNEKSLKEVTTKKCIVETNSMKSKKRHRSDSFSSSSDLEEVQCHQEPILIDSSSSSNYDETDRFSPFDSSKSNIDEDTTVQANLLSSTSSEISDEGSDSPPPSKKLKEGNEGSKVSLNMLSSSLFSDRWKKAHETVKKTSLSTGKIRIAHVPNVTSLLSAKDKLIAKVTLSTKDDLTLSKKTEDIYNEPDTSSSSRRIRKAHTPSQNRLKYPSVIMDENLKIPFSVRQICLNNLFEEYHKFFDEEIAKKQAQTEELEICRRVHVIKTYQNAVALAVLKIRKGKKDARSSEVSSNLLLSTSIPDYTYGWTIYKCFAEYLIKEEEFVSNGFPVEIESKSGCGYIEKSARRYDVKQPDDPCLRTCAHCSSNYYIDEKGFPIKEYDCFYHWGRLGRTKVRGGITEFYRCCNGEIGSEPCTNGRYHVCNSYDEDCLEGFVASRPSNENPEKAGIYAMDCEMCYTTKGLDLTRCTVVDLNGKVVYDEVVVPESPILDYNTRFSGITEDMVVKSRKKLRHVQRDLLKLINENSILVGHSLENDLKALRLFHKTVVDTSIVFPHHMGLPYKKALKIIAKDILKINIQENESGHDSYEDSNTCMLIMMAKIKDDAKKRKPRVIISLDSKGKTVQSSQR